VQNGTAFQPAEVELGRESGDFVEVKNGLFDGDVVVTQRATQLYAQSLRGGAQPADDHHEATPATPTASSTLPLPWWLVIPAGGAIAAGTFLAGMYWGKRRDRRSSIASEFALETTPSARDPIPPTPNGATPASLTPHPQDTPLPPHKSH
jgi:membrane fusion protein, heavy metal efflux system